MDYNLYLSAWMLGLLGSFHCAGMCGPIAIMLPKFSSRAQHVVLSRVLYNTGRVITYIMLGFLFGVIGLAASIRGFQNELSVVTGVIVAVITILTWGKKPVVNTYKITNAWSGGIRQQLKKVFSNRSFFSFLLLGIFNGLLPCGFVYLAIAGATATASFGGAVAYMAFFGLGTFPMMMAVSVFTDFVGLKFRNIINRLSPFISIMLAFYLIYRGTDMQKNTSATQPHNIKCFVVKQDEKI